MRTTCVLAGLLLLLAGFALFQHRSRQRSTERAMEQRLRDWPQFSRYGAANQAAVSKRAPASEVVFLGDSITDYWDLRRSFPQQAYTNRGVEAQTTAQMLLRFRADVLALQPRCVVIEGGTNDIAQGMTWEWTTQNLASMAELARAHGICVVLVSVLPVYDVKGYQRTALHPLINIQRLNAWMRNYAQANGYVYADAFSRMATPEGTMKPGLSDDGLHPNDTGYRVLADTIAAALEFNPGAHKAD